MRRLLLFIALSLSACSPAFNYRVQPPPIAASDIGVLVMAHGGKEEWNRQVARVVAPLANTVPTAVAFGMANRGTLQAALDSLEARGVRRVAVVRMFLSGASFLDQTNYYLGMSETPPESFILMGPGVTDSEAREPIRHGLALATHPDGLLTSPEARSIAVERVLTRSANPARESVLLIAHGMADEGENDQVLAAMGSAVDVIRTLGFAHVKAGTLREDWPEQRSVAEADMRSFVSQETEAGRRVIVVPVRLAGFGPYAEVLSGLHYDAAEGLLPHDAIAEWIQKTAVRVTCGAGWGPLLGACAEGSSLSEGIH